MSDSGVPMLTALPYAGGAPGNRGRIRSTPEDFRVFEDLGFETSGAGEHLFVQVRKRGANTAWVAQRLAELAGLKPGAVSYAGLKDRHALAEQWFSMHLPGCADPDWAQWQEPGVEVLTTARHHRKLRRGALRGNRFVLIVREISGDRDALERRLRSIAARGVPNYYGEQRFGRDGGNLAKADALLRGRLRRIARHERGIYLSAARSFLFNQALAQRVATGSWAAGVDGDVMMLDGSQSVFVAEALDDSLRMRLQNMDIHPTAPLWGRGELMSRHDCRAIEEQALATFAEWRQGLERCGLNQERRSVRLKVSDLGWHWLDEETLSLQFALPAGSYATSVVREIVDYLGVASA